MLHYRYPICGKVEHKEKFIAYIDTPSFKSLVDAAENEKEMSFHD